MRRLVPLAVSVVLIFTVLAVLISRHDASRATLLGAVCQAGLPNFSLPHELRDTVSDCSIFSPKRRFRGVLTTGFEVSSFSSPDFPKVNVRRHPFDRRAWFNCPIDGCGGKLDAQLESNYSAACNRDELLNMSAATVDVEGWVTLSEGEFGHLGQYTREFHASRIVTVAPAPQELTEYLGELNGCD